MKIKHLLCGLGLFFTSLALTSAQEEIWITPNGTDGTGTGSASNPYVCASQSTFDALMDGSTIPANSTIHLMPGTFHTIGEIPIITGWKIRGAGMDSTIVQLVDIQSYLQAGHTLFYDGTNEPSNFCLRVFAVPSYNPFNGVEVSDLTVDCNLQNQGAALSIGAVTILGSDERISRVKAINWGAGTNQECPIFQIAAPGDPYPAVTNDLIDDCVLESPAHVYMPQGADGFVIEGAASMEELLYPGTNSWLSGGEIRNCRIYNVPVGSGLGQLSYFSGMAFTDVDGGKMDNNIFVNVGGQCAVTSCGSLANISIDNNMFINVGVGIDFQSDDWCGADNEITNSVKENIEIANNFMTLQSGGTGISISGLKGHTLTNLMVANNLVQGISGATGVNDLAVSTVANLTAVNNTLDNNGSGTLMSIDTNVVISQINNNATLTGSNVTTPLWSANVIANYLGVPGSCVGVSSDSEDSSLSINNGQAAGNAFSMGTNYSSNAQSYSIFGSMAFSGGIARWGSLAFDGAEADNESLAFGYDHTYGYGPYSGNAHATDGSLAFGCDYSNAIVSVSASTNSLAIGDGEASTYSFIMGGGIWGAAQADLCSMGFGPNSHATNNSFALGEWAYAQDYSLASYGAKAVNYSIALGSWARATNSSFVVSLQNDAGYPTFATNYQWVAAGFTNGYLFKDGSFTIANNLNVSGTVSGNSLSTTISNTTPAAAITLSTSGLHGAASWTNTTSGNIVAYLIGFNGNVGYNGAAIYTNVESAMVLLQPHSYLSITNEASISYNAQLNWHPF